MIHIVLPVTILGPAMGRCFGFSTRVADFDLDLDRDQRRGSRPRSADLEPLE